MFRRVAVLLIVTLLLPVAASGAQLTTPDLRKMRKWAPAEKTLVIAYDAWMSSEELNIVLGLMTGDERMDFMAKLGWVEKWKNDLKDLDDIRAAIEAQEVIVGMNQDQVFMAWDKPAKIRKDFKKEAYINVLNYEFERDRKGKEFRLVPDSQTAYKNEVFLKFVYMYNDRVFRIVNEGEEEDVMDELPEAAPPKGESSEQAPAKDEADASSGEGDGTEGATPDTEGDATPETDKSGGETPE